MRVTVLVGSLLVAMLALQCDEDDTQDGPVIVSALSGTWLSVSSWPSTDYYNGAYVWGEDTLTVSAESTFVRRYYVHGSDCCPESTTILRRYVRGRIDSVTDTCFLLLRTETVESTFVQTALCWPLPCDLGLRTPEIALRCLKRNDTIFLPSADSLRFRADMPCAAVATWMPYWRRVPQ
jgi:hypothetical protein